MWVYALFVLSSCTLKRQSETDLQGVVYPRHGRFVQLAHAVFQPPFVQCADLLQQHHAVLGQSAGGCGWAAWLFPADW